MYTQKEAKLMYTVEKVKELINRHSVNKTPGLNLDIGLDISGNIDLINLPVKSLSELFPPNRIITETTTSGILFNVMPGKNVKETLMIKEYRIWDRYIEAVFDREYLSEMKKSPDHLIFLTALVHMQKILYVYVCHEFGIEYAPGQDEKIKFWPIKLELSIPKLIRSQEDVVHKLSIDSIIETDANGYLMKARSIVDRSMIINGESPFFFIK
jgi:hypothetical protein